MQLKCIFLTKRIKLYTQTTIPLLLLNNVNFIPNNFLQKFFKIVLTLWKTLVLTKPHLYLWPNKLFKYPTIHIFYCEEWLPITTHENNFLKWIVQKPQLQVLRTIWVFTHPWMFGDECFYLVPIVTLGSTHRPTCLS